MFIPSVSSVNRVPIAIGNPDHPVANYVVSMLATPVVNRADLWCIRTVTDMVTITYHPSSRTLRFYELSFDMFKEHVKLGTLASVSIIFVPTTDKHIGNSILRNLIDIYSQQAA